MADFRVAGAGANIASRFDSALSQRLRDGVVSEQDMKSAAQIFANLLKNPPMPNQWGQTNQYAAQRWNEQAKAAASLFGLVDQAYRNQSPHETRRETRKDAGLSYTPRPQQNAGWGAPRWGTNQVVSPPQTDAQTLKKERNVAIGIAIFAGLAAIAANNAAHK